MVSTVDTSTQCINRGNVPVEIIDSPVVVKPEIQISGYNLKVIIKDDLGVNLPNSQVVLSSIQELQFDDSPINSEKPVGKKFGLDWLYSLKTDLNGLVNFYCLPPGKYLIKASYSKKNWS